MTCLGLHKNYYQTLSNVLEQCKFFKLMHCMSLIIIIMSFPLLRHYCLSIERTLKNGLPYTIQAYAEIAKGRTPKPEKRVKKNTPRPPKCFWQGTGVCACSVCIPKPAREAA